MTDLQLMIVGGVLPLAVALGWASLSESFRFVLKSVFTFGNTSSPIAWADVHPEPPPSTDAERDKALQWERTLQGYVKATESIAKVTVNDTELIITIIGNSSKKLREQEKISHYGKHARGTTVTERAE